MAANESEEDRLVRQQVVNNDMRHHSFSVTRRDLRLPYIMQLAELAKTWVSSF